MINSTRCLTLVLCLSLFSSASAQVGTLRHFPDVEGYRTLVCDFHMHTVFSDGQVWPTVRVDEAWREGLDAMSITDHIEYQPHKDDIPTQHNRPYEIAKGRAAELDILLIHGAEITRDTPPGHYNALFIQDANQINEKEFLGTIEKANQQQGFVFWNHHTWHGPEKGQWEDVQGRMLDNRWLHGMEVANGETYYPLAHQWCLDKGLTMVGNSDIHGPSIDYRYTAEQHRTLTLVFAKERTIAAIQEALCTGRTAVWYKNQLIGKQDTLEPLVHACLQVSPPHHQSRTHRFFRVTNWAMIDLQLEGVTKGAPKKITLPARSRIVVKLPKNLAASVAFKVSNVLVAPEQPLGIRWDIPTESLDK